MPKVKIRGHLIEGEWPGFWVSDGQGQFLVTLNETLGACGCTCQSGYHVGRGLTYDCQAAGFYPERVNHVGLVFEAILKGKIEAPEAFKQTIRHLKKIPAQGGSASGIKSKKH